MSPFFGYLLLRSICGTENYDATAMFVNNQHGIQQRGQDFNKSLYWKGYTAKRLTDGFPEKLWTKHDVNRISC